jgi:hypothetical protein
MGASGVGCWASLVAHELLRTGSLPALFKGSEICERVREVSTYTAAQ